MTRLQKLLQTVTPWTPMFLRSFVRRHLPLQDYDLARRRDANPYHDKTEASFPDSRWRLGIVEDMGQAHCHYLAACHDLRISHRCIDLLADDWITQVTESGCDAFLVWPNSTTTPWKEAFDYRLRILEHDLGKIVFPTWQECWLTEHKPRLRDWLTAHNIPHPKTWVLYRRDEAMALAASIPLPVVSKTATGACGSGVEIIRDRASLRRLIRQAFGRGQCPRGHDPNDRQRGYVFLQEYLPNAQEWRMVRIGESYFGYRKEKGETGLHSASHRWSWLDPGEKLLNLLKHVTDVFGFKSMDVDIFLTEDGRMLVNECQTTFGCTTPAEQMKINGIEGRYLFDNDTGNWQFEPGSYCYNHMCNLRIEHLISFMERNP